MASPCVSEIEFYVSLAGDRTRLTVCGTHGKTTTSALLVHILERAGTGSRIPSRLHVARPRWHLAARYRAVRLRGRRVHVRTVGSAPEVPPHAAARRVRHAPRARSPRRLRNVSTRIASRSSSSRRRCRADGVLALCADDPECLALRGAAQPRCSHLWHESRERLAASSMRASRTALQHFRWSAASRRPARRPRSRFPGIHNAQNACAALILAEYAGVDARGRGERVRRLPRARRAASRSSASVDGVAVVDDYAHHPTEVAAAIDAARQRYPGRRLIAIHTPHTYSRVSRLLEDYRRSFTGADVVIIGPIEEARERGHAEDRSRAQDVAERAAARRDVHVVDSSDEAIDLVTRITRPGDVAARAVPRRLRQAGAAPPRRPGGPGCPRVSGSTRLPACAAMSRSRGTASSASVARRDGSSPRVTPARSARCCGAATTSGVPVTMLGAGSNTLISDDGIDGLVIRHDDRTLRVVDDAHASTSVAAHDAARGARLRSRAASRDSSSASACPGPAARACTATPARSGPRWPTCSSTAPSLDAGGSAVTLQRRGRAGSRIADSRFKHDLRDHVVVSARLRVHRG